MKPWQVNESVRVGWKGGGGGGGGVVVGLWLYVSSLQPSSSERLLNEMLNRSERSKLGAALDYCWFDHPARSGLSQGSVICIFCIHLQLF